MAGIISQAIADTVDAVGSKAPVATFGGSAVGIFGGVNDWNMIATIGGIVIGLAGLLVTIFFKRREDRRRQILHDLEMSLRISAAAVRASQ